ncbi:hypothetical protein [Dethiosulfatarculus sandiegensis]|uniref:Uncharacterized protein n=1 Tax=Dethiosulfatarculus sandiegensis TaxID=1429043 RepID=A0A0D2J2J1_9BACT|nr:hypothetical protein [Dethiosulfatarculus sandiegensis]KIX12419.1 hypothetical protein X474_18985 [Dethiosulfatarculus sandiegensis]
MEDRQDASDVCVSGGWTVIPVRQAAKEVKASESAFIQAGSTMTLAGQGTR